MSQKDLIEKTINFLKRRQRSYLVTFNKESVDTQNILKDLAKFCRADDSTYNIDSRAHARLEGRREVYLRIKDHVELSFEDLYEKYGGQK